MGRGQKRRENTDRLGVYFTDRAIIVAGVDLSHDVPVITWATTASVNHGAIIDGIVRDVRATTQSLMNAQLPHRPAVVAVPAQRRADRHDDESVVACALSHVGVTELTVRRRTLARVEHVLERSGMIGEGWIPQPFAELMGDGLRIEDPEGLASSGVDLTIALGAALWGEPEPWPPAVEPASPHVGWRVAKVS